MTAKEIVVVQPEPPIATEVIAQAIVDISTAMKKLNSTRLTRDALIHLIHGSAKGRVNKTEVTVVLDCLDQLERVWLKPLPVNGSKPKRTK